VTARACLFAWLLVSACTPEVVPAGGGLSRYVFTENHFGDIPVELTLYTTGPERAQAAARSAFARIAELSAMMSDYAYDPPSPLNRIAAEAPGAVAIPRELLTALARGVDHHRFTEGAFDITAKPLVQLWRVSRRVGELPPENRLRRAKHLVDISALELDRSASTARLAREGMWLDLGGLAKGYVGDEVVRLLREEGVPICRYHAGGDMVFGDAPPGESGWLVNVVDFPLELRVSNSAVSVSGDQFRFVEIAGRRYAHVIDPRTGLGVTERRIACVRGPRGIDTDPLATAGLILDEESWQRALARVPGCRGWVRQPDPRSL
jgi:FAD:protein FMN transferase